DDREPSACSELVVILDVIPPDCGQLPQMGNSFVPLSPYSCDSLVEYCVRIDPFIDGEFNLLVNGELTEGSNCRMRTYDHYDLSSLVNDTCDYDQLWDINLQYVWVNNESIDGIPFSNGYEMAEWMSDQWVNTWHYDGEGGLWSLNTGIPFGDMLLFVDCIADFAILENTPQELPTGQSVFLNPNAESVIQWQNIDQPYCFTQQNVVVDCIGNHPPVTINSDSQTQLEFETTIPENSDLQFCFDLFDVNGNEVVVDTLFVSPTSSGLFWNDGDNCVFYFSDDNQVTDTITIQYCDNGIPSLCNESILIVNVENPNHPPNAEDDFIELDDNGGTSIDVLGNDSDIDEDELFISSADVLLGEVFIVDGIIFYQPPASYCGNDTIWYSICDSLLLCDSAMVVISIELSDQDSDGIVDAIEGTEDSDGDGIPDLLDSDSDNDGIPDGIEGYTGGNVNSCADDPSDVDDDGVPNYLDDDSDGDGLPDSVELLGDCDDDNLPNFIDPFDFCDEEEVPSDRIIP
ncbi:MAG: Ig-like domain-containing protein, partial [Flavobacteriales bacterium]